MGFQGANHCPQNPRTHHHQLFKFLRIFYYYPILLTLYTHYGNSKKTEAPTEKEQAQNVHAIKNPNTEKGNHYARRNLHRIFKQKMEF